MPHSSQHIDALNASLKDIHDFACDLAKQAGQLIADKRAQGNLAENYKGQHELVTDADIAADKMIIEAIQARFPDHRLMSEETYNDKSQSETLEQPIWIIDPIDGTVNYAHGQMMVGVSIALAFAGDMQVGVVYNPFMDECFSTYKGQPAWLNGQSISPSGLEELRKAVIATGFPYDKSGVAPIIRRVETMLMHCQDIRRLGSAALDICWVACGRLDGYFESLSPWDFAAARLIALNAGARCGHFNPNTSNTPDCIHDQDLLISTPAIYNDMDKLLD